VALQDPEASTQAASPDGLNPPDRPAEAFSRGALLDRYTILHAVGRGGMGEVYAAYDGKLDRRVALKLLLSREPQGESRLSREAQAMARLSHPNVVAVFDTGMVEGRLFLAMEFVQGTTLRVWQRDRQRTVAEILRVYVRAGRGLAAAHDAELVHRDFKPDNVLVSTRGAVKVTDFGLVRTEELEGGSPEAALERLMTKLSSVRPPPLSGEPRDTLPLEPTEADIRVDSKSGSGSSFLRSLRSGPLETPMTEVGVVLGTLGYMAPEQYVSQPVNAKTDQFSFCVALYDALYGQKPFAGKGVLELADATMNGRVREPPKGKNVPARIHRALLRGLKPKKDDRYPTMAALLADLEYDPAKDRARLGFAVAGVLLAVVVFAAVRISFTQKEKLCSGADTLAREVWNDQLRQRLEQAMLATNLPFAPDTWARTHGELDGYMQRWSKMHEQTCRATRVLGHQPEALMAVRMACLEERRSDVRALVRLLEHADRQTVEKAVEASQSLPGVADCADVTSLTSVQPLPADAAQRSNVETIGREVGELRVLGDAGKYKDVATSAAPLVERARAAAYPPVLAEALLVLGEAQDRLGKKGDAAATLREAVFAAEAGRIEDVKVHALVSLVAVLADQRKFDDAHTMSSLAGAASSRLSDPDAFRADLLSANAWVLCRDGKYDESAAEFHKAITVAERNADAKPVRLARMYSRAGGMLGDAGHFDEALDLLGRADATFVRFLGKDHPSRLPTFVNRGATLIDQGRFLDSLATTDTALAMAVRVLPPESGTPANLYNNRAAALNELRRFDEARAAGERAVEIGRTVFGAKAVNTAGYMITTAEALVGLHRDADAAATFAEVLTIIDPALPADHEWQAEARTVRAEAALHQGQPQLAMPDLERALKIYGGIASKTYVARRNEALAETALARALFETGVRTARAGELLAKGASTLAALHDQADLDDVGTWAKAHGLTTGL